MITRPRRALAALAITSAFAQGCAGFLPGHVYERVQGRFVSSLDPARLGATFAGLDPRRKGEPHRVTKLDLFRGSSLMEDAKLEKSLRHVRDRLLAHVPADVPEIGVFATSDAFYSARATPGGDILIDLGLLTQIESEDELAFTLAHELAHILLDHFERNDVVNAQGKAIELAVSAGAVSIVFRNSTVVETPSGGTKIISNATQKQGMAESALRLAMGYLAIQELVYTLFEPAWNRAQESEADLLALDLVVAAGYEPSYALAVFDKLAAAETEKVEMRKKWLQKYATERAALLATAALSENDLFIDKTVRAVGADVGFEATKYVRSLFQQRYQGVEARRDNVTGYYRREYQAMEPTPSGVDPIFPAVMKEKPLRDVVEHHERAREAYIALREGNLEEAGRLGLEAISAPTARAAFPRYVLFQVRAQERRFGDAMTNLERVDQSPGVSPNIDISLAGAYLSLRDPNRALGIIARAADRVESIEPFLDLQIQAARAAGKTELMNASLETCRGMDDKALVTRCESAAGVTPNVAAAAPSNPATGFMSTFTNNLRKGIGSLFGWTEKLP